MQSRLSTTSSGGSPRKPALSFRLPDQSATRRAREVLPKYGSRPMTGSRSSCRSSTSFRPSGITVLRLGPDLADRQRHQSRDQPRILIHHCHRQSRRAVAVHPNRRPDRAQMAGVSGSGWDWRLCHAVREQRSTGNADPVGCAGDLVQQFAVLQLPLLSIRPVPDPHPLARDRLLSIPGAGCRLHSPASSWRFCFHLGGVNAVFGFIAFAMAIVVITIGGFGPRTRGLALEAIAH